MTDLPSSRISDEEVRALAFVIAKAIPRITHRGDDGAQTFYADLFAQMLAEAGWRREADVLREAADTLEARYPTDVWHPASTSPDAQAARGVRVACGQLRHLATERDGATALEPVGALSVAEGSEAKATAEIDRLRGIVRDVIALTRSTDGDYLNPEEEIPVGEIQRVLYDRECSEGQRHG